MIDIDTAIERLENAIRTLRAAKGILDTQTNGDAPKESGPLKGRPPKIDAAMRERLRAMRAAGKTMAALVKVAGCSEPTVRRSLRA